MKLDTKLIKETKELKNNVFVGSQLISFDDDETVAIVTILNEEMEELGDRSFGIDLNTFRLLKSLEECDIEYDDFSNQLIIKIGKNKKYKTKTIKQSIPALIESEFTGNIVIDGYKLQTAKSFTATTESRPILTGVAITNNKNIYASDSYKAYRYLASNEEPITTIVVPSLYLSLINCNKDVEISYSDKVICVVEENRFTYGRLLSGEYPLKPINSFFDNNVLIDINKLDFQYDDILENINLSKNVGDDNGKIKPRLLLEGTYFKVESASIYEANIKVSWNEERKGYHLLFDLTLAKELFQFAKKLNGNIYIKEMGTASQLIIVNQQESMLYCSLRG